MKKPTIVDIPEKMEKYYGKGKMLHPDMELIENLISRIPRGKLTTINALAQKLASDFGVDVTCPMRTGNAIKKIAERYSNGDYDERLPFWRVLRTDNLVINSKNHDFAATKLEDEGFKLQYAKTDNIRIDLDPKSFFQF